MMGQTSVIADILPIHPSTRLVFHPEILGTMTVPLIHELEASLISRTIPTSAILCNTPPTSGGIQHNTALEPIDGRPAPPCRCEHPENVAEITVGLPLDELPPPELKVAPHIAVDDTLPSTESPPEVANKIVRILERYRMAPRDNCSSQWAARSLFIEKTVHYIEQRSEIRMSLPAFPFKSPNKTSKVLGSLPDFGEEIALLHLNGMCQAIGDVYEHGAKLYIVSDGLMYNVSSRIPSFLSQSLLTSPRTSLECLT